jgi:hypothetical protein
MLCLSDNDLLLNLAAWNLLPEFVEYLKTDFKLAKDEIRILESFIRQLKTNSNWQNQYGDKVLERARTFCEDIPRLSLTVDVSATIALHNAGIDPGEAVLTAVAISHKDSIIATNDLRFIAQLEAHTELTEYRAQLKGRILHLRQVILGILEIKEYDFVRSRISPEICKSTDRRIYRIFSQGDRSRAFRGIKDAIEEARLEAKDLLYVKEP